MLGVAGDLYGAWLCDAGFDSPQLLQYMEESDVSGLVAKLRKSQIKSLHLTVLQRALMGSVKAGSERTAAKGADAADEEEDYAAAALRPMPRGGGGLRAAVRLPDITESAADETDDIVQRHTPTQNLSTRRLLLTSTHSSNHTLGNFDSTSSVKNSMAIQSPGTRALTLESPLPTLRASNSHSSMHRRLPQGTEDADMFKPNAFRDQKKMKRSISSVVNYPGSNFQQGSWARSPNKLLNESVSGQSDGQGRDYSGSEISFPDLHSPRVGTAVSPPTGNDQSRGRKSSAQGDSLRIGRGSFGNKRNSMVASRRLSVDKQYKSYKSFVPRQLLRGIGDCVAKGPVPRVRCESLKGAILFADASGFTALTTTLAQQNGKDAAAKLCEILNRFFDVIIKIVNKHAGDVVKFSGDALTILFRAPDHIRSSSDTPLHEATRQAALCAWDIHNAIGGAKGYLGYEDPTDSKRDVYMALHMGLGCGDLTGLVVGGAFQRKEFIMAGPPLTQIGIAEPLAESGETVASPEAWGLISKYFTGSELAQQAGFMRIDTKVDGLDLMDASSSVVDGYTLDIVDEVKQFLPRAVRDRIALGQDGRLAEMLNVSVVFVNVKGIDLHAADEADSARALQVAQRLMLRVQESCYRSEGSINKALIDDKGLLIVCAFGLPGCYHMDDAARSIILAKDLSTNILRVTGDDTISSSIGVATGVAYCGPVGSQERREYTMMGTVPNLAARLMSKAGKDGVLIDKTTLDSAKEISGDVSFQFVPEQHDMKGLGSVDVFRPSLHQKPADQVDKTKAEKNAILENLIYGRNMEVQRLRRIVYDLKVQRGGGLILSGNKGTGKSMIVKILEKTATNYGLCVLKASSKKAKDKKAPLKYAPRALPKKVEAELEYYFDITLGEKLHGDTEQSPEIYEVWHTIVQQCMTRSVRVFVCVRACI